MAGVLIACGDQTPSIPDPILVIRADEDQRTGSFNTAAFLGCRAVVYDNVNHRLHVYESGHLRFSFGQRGSGPGELGHVKSLGIAPDLSIAAIDWGRRRLLWWEPNGELRDDRVLDHSLYQHALVGAISPKSDGSYFDFPFSGAVFGFALTPGNTDTLPLIYEVDSAGRVRGEWGRLDTPKQLDAPLLRGLLQLGDFQVTSESIYVFHAVRPRVDVFSIAGNAKGPERSIMLPVWVNHAEPREMVGRVTEGNTVEGASIELNEDAGAPFARDAAGRYYTLMLDAKPERKTLGAGEGWWPREQLWIFDADGRKLGAWALKQRGTRMMRIARDGSIVVLARPSGQEDDDWALIVYRPILDGSGYGPSCEWKID
jgi:hypothetical protein